MKKNLITLVAVLLTSTIAFAQSGKMFVTGNLGFSTLNSKQITEQNSNTNENQTQDAMNFGINASFHYKIIDNLAVGLGLGYNTGRTWLNTTNNKDANSYENEFRIIPSAIYFINLNDKFQYAPELFISLGFGGINNQVYNPITDEIVDNKSSTFGFGVGITPLSFNYNMTDNLALSFSLGEISFSNYKESVKDPAPLASDETVSNTFNIRLNSGFKIGLRYFF